MVHNGWTLERIEGLYRPTQWWKTSPIFPYQLEIKIERLQATKNYRKLNTIHGTEAKVVFGVDFKWKEEYDLSETPLPWRLIELIYNKCIGDLHYYWF